MVWLESEAWAWSEREDASLIVFCRFVANTAVVNQPEREREREVERERESQETSDPEKQQAVRGSVVRKLNRER